MRATPAVSRGQPQENRQLLRVVRAPCPVVFETEGKRNKNKFWQRRAVFRYSQDIYGMRSFPVMAENKVRCTFSSRSCQCDPTLFFVGRKESDGVHAADQNNLTQLPAVGEIKHKGTLVPPMSGRSFNRCQNNVRDNPRCAAASWHPRTSSTKHQPI